MPTPAHTPGPWKTSETVHSDGYTGKHYWTIYPQHAPADIIVALPVASDKENDRAEANARLIASAPTLAREHAEMRALLAHVAANGCGPAPSPGDGGGEGWDERAGRG